MEKQRKGRYSGNIRLDPATLKEPDQDDESSRKMWLEDVYYDEDFRAEQQKKVDAWRQNVATTLEPSKLTVHAVGESHIDCAWLWRFEQTRQKAAITFKKAITHAKMFPGKFNFALSEPLLLEWILEDQPELFKEIQETVKTGGIELVGGAYVEPDCMMPSGEAFARSRLFGMRFLRDHFGQLPEVEWFLDSFGYNWGIPQILAKSGAKYFWTTKITWNLITVFPFVYFDWEGPDGTRLLTSNFGMGASQLDRWLWFDPGRRPLKPGGRKVWNYEINYEEIEDHVDENETIPHVGYFFGKGDGGHGPSHQEVAQANYFVEAGLMKWSKIHTFFKEIEKYRDRLPVWQDELYLENHQGTFSVHAEVKRHNRKYENWLTSVETLALLTSLLDPTYPYPFDAIEQVWKMDLRNQFHDVLPGSSIPEVYDDCWDDWMWADDLLAKVEKDAGQIWVKHANKKSADEKTTGHVSTEIALYNPVAWDRRGPVFIPISVFESAGKKVPLDRAGKPPYALLMISTDPGREYICQPIAAESAETIEAVPAGWYCVLPLKGISVTPATITLASKDQQIKGDQITATQNALSNGGVSVKIDPTTGAILELKVEGINGGKNLLKGTDSNLTFAFEDTPKQWPAWNLKEEYWKYPLNMPNNKDVKIQVREIGPVFASIAITRTLGTSPVTQTITLFSDCQGVFLEYLTDWQTPEVMLKVAYTTATNAEYSTADIAYAAIRRKTQPETPNDKARYEKIMHKYCDVSTPGNDWGIALLNEGKYAFDTMGEPGIMRLTMLRSPPYPGPAGESWAHAERAMNREKFGHEVPKYSGLGPFKCRYALFPHIGGCLVNSNGSANPLVKRKADEFNQPVAVIPTPGLTGDKTGAPLLGESLFEVLTPNAFVGALKQNEWNKSGTLILRLVEGCGLNGPAEIKLHPQFTARIKSVKSVDILERPTREPFTWDPASGILKCDVTKYEIRTFEIEW
jgi:alpha-mannosidase